MFLNSRNILFIRELSKSSKLRIKGQRVDLLSLTEKLDNEKQYQPAAHLE